MGRTAEKLDLSAAGERRQQLGSKSLGLPSSGIMRGTLSHMSRVSDLITVSVLVLKRSLGRRTWVSGYMMSRS